MSFGRPPLRQHGTLGDIIKKAFSYFSLFTQLEKVQSKLDVRITTKHISFAIVTSVSKNGYTFDTKAMSNV
jgi:hypothetical protein